MSLQIPPNCFFHIKKELLISQKLLKCQTIKLYPHKRGVLLNYIIYKIKPNEVLVDYTQSVLYNVYYVRYKISEVIVLFNKFKMDLKVNNRKDPLIISSLFTYRLGNWIYYDLKVPLLKHLVNFLYRFLDLFIIRICNNALIPAKCKIGGGLRLPHGGNGIVIHPNVTIGEYATIFHQVTIGNKDTPYESYGSPNIGNFLFVGAGAKILGEVKLDNNVIVGANSVVLSDIPSNSTAVGSPARIINSNTMKVI